MKQELKLIFQGNLKISGPEEGEQLYTELKIFIKAIDPDCILNGQIIKMLEPCCKDKKELKPNA